MVEVRVPATSANLGPGFDAFGMAFQLYNTFRVKENTDENVIISGVDQRYQNKSNLFYQAMQQVFRRVCYHPKGVTIHCENQIPFSRGLGSSASCIAGGMMTANVISGNYLSENELFQLAVKMEGHADNIAAAFFGGLVVVQEMDGQNVLIKNDVSDCYVFCAVIPDFSVWTGEARNILPAHINHEDGAFNVSHAVMTYLALTQNYPEILKNSIQDRLHQPYRKNLIKDYDLLEKMAYEHGALGVCISGSGPTVLIISDKKNNIHLSKILNNWILNHHPRWQYIPLIPDSDGAILSIIEDGESH